jgi:predicted O-methyltransferase YrrM
MIDEAAKQRMLDVLATIPQEQYTDGYTDPTGKEGFRNPVRPIVAEGLTRIVELLKPERAVELGTALGSSGIRFGLGGLKILDTVEFDPEAAQIAQTNFANAGLNGFRVHNMDSGEFVKNWDAIIDLIFIDHAKPRYLEDLQALEGSLTPTGLVLLDNTYNRQPECKDAVAYVADNYFSGIFTEPPSPGVDGPESTGLMVASKDREVFDQAWKVLMDVRGAS